MDKICKVEGCSRKHVAKGYCDKHYRQLKRNGKILKRTKYDENEIIYHSDYAEVVLYNKEGKETEKAKISLECVDLIKTHKWHMNTNGYVVTNHQKGKIISMHRFIMNPMEDMVVDHINGDKLDNRLENLRICKHRENDWNKGIISTNTSGATGVVLTPWNTWCARIEVNKKRIHLGTFKTFEEAVQTRKEAEIKYFGEYRYQEGER